jgi:hypothetical protein
LPLKFSDPHLQLNAPLSDNNRLMAQQAEGPGVSLSRELVGNLGYEVLHPFVFARDFGFTCTHHACPLFLVCSCFVPYVKYNAERLSVVSVK